MGDRGDRSEEGPVLTGHGLHGLRRRAKAAGRLSPALANPRDHVGGVLADRAQ